MAMQEYEKYAFEKKNNEHLKKSAVEDLLTLVSHLKIRSSCSV